MDRWHLGLDPSAIQDGTYADFHRGQQADFVVEFQTVSWEEASGPPAAVRVDGYRYDLEARVAAVGEQAWVLDCGLLVGCRGRPPTGAEVGRHLRGRGVLTLSPHPDQLQAEGLPSLGHTWFAERVFHRTGDDGDLGALSIDLSGFEGLYGGPEEPGWEELGFTSAWQDDDGRADYLLECLLATEPDPAD